MNEYISEVQCDNDYVAELPQQCTFTLDVETVREIRKLAALVKEHNLYKTEKFDYRVEWGTQVEAPTLNVGSDEFWFAAYLKHTDIEITTEHLKIADLEIAE